MSGYAIWAYTGKLWRHCCSCSLIISSISSKYYAFLMDIPTSGSLQISSRDVLNIRWYEPFWTPTERSGGRKKKRWASGSSMLTLRPVWRWEAAELDFCPDIKQETSKANHQRSCSNTEKAWTEDKCPSWHLSSSSPSQLRHKTRTSETWSFSSKTGRWGDIQGQQMSNVKLFSLDFLLSLLHIHPLTHPQYQSSQSLDKLSHWFLLFPTF